MYRLSKNDKVVIFAVGDKKVALVRYGKYGTLSINDVTQRRGKLKGVKEEGGELVFLTLVHKV